MNTATLLRDLEERGVRFETEDGRLRYHAPTGVLTPEIIDELRARKPELLVLLASLYPPDPVKARNLAAAWRGAVRKLCEIAGYPCLPFKPGFAVGSGAANWGTFIARASVPSLRMVAVALRDLLAATPPPEEQISCSLNARPEEDA